MLNWNHSILKQATSFIDLLGNVFAENREPALYSGDLGTVDSLEQPQTWEKFWHAGSVVHSSSGQIALVLSA
nr:hypothetical protein CFP56_31293 [Quercus suber]